MPDSLSCSLQMTDNDHQFCTMKWKLWSGYANEAGDQPLWSRTSPTSQMFMIFFRHTTGLFLLSQLKTQSYLCRCLNKIPNYRSHQIQTCMCLKQLQQMPLYREPSFTKKAWCEKCKLPDTCSRLCWSRQTIRCRCHEQIIKYQVAFWWSLKN